MDTPKFDPLSRSAPSDIPDFIDRISIGSSDSEQFEDEFTRLKNLRQEERLMKLKENLSRSVSRSGPDGDTELLLEKMSPP